MPGASRIFVKESSTCQSATTDSSDKPPAPNSYRCPANREESNVEVVFHPARGNTMQDSTDEELAVAAGAGDNSAFAELFARHHKLLVRQSRRQLGGDWDSAEEIAQQTWVKAHQHLKSYDPQRRPFVSWLHTIRIRLIIDENKRKKPKSIQDLVAALPAADHNESTESGADVHAALDALPDELATAVRVVYLEDNTFAQAAAILGCSAGCVHKRSVQAITLLRRMMGSRVTIPVSRVTRHRPLAVTNLEIQMMVA